MQTKNYFENNNSIDSYLITNNLNDRNLTQNSYNLEINKDQLADAVNYLHRQLHNFKN